LNDKVATLLHLKLCSPATDFTEVETKHQVNSMTVFCVEFGNGRDKLKQQHREEGESNGEKQSWEDGGEKKGVRPAGVHNGGYRRPPCAFYGRFTDMKIADGND
jgi:hypothetical protein